MRPLAWKSRSGHSPWASATPGSGVADCGSRSGGCFALGGKGHHQVPHKAKVGSAAVACCSTGAPRAGSETAAWLLRGCSGRGPRSLLSAWGGQPGQGEAVGVKPERGGTSPSWAEGAVEGGQPFSWLGTAVTSAPSPPAWPMGLLATPLQICQPAQHRGDSLSRPVHASGVCAARQGLPLSPPSQQPILAARSPRIGRVWMQPGRKGARLVRGAQSRSRMG